MLPAPLEESGPKIRGGVRVRVGAGAAAGLCALLVACGGGERQDEAEPAGEYPVSIVTSEFPNRQRLAQTSNLRLGIANTGDRTIPDLAVTITTDPNADESFSVRSEQSGLAIPSRPVWILENGYPKLAGQSAPGGAEAAQTRTFSFGALEPNQTREMVWRLTPVQAGTYTVSYRVSAGLQGKAVAINADGSEPAGEFVVTISDVPPQTRVDDSGNVVPIQKGDIIGQAGSEQQRSEVGGGGGGGGGAQSSGGSSP
jgi:hypothetical protein